ncbi:hypothetical protein V1478_017014 [Vespula squamosa]|uniref:Uncharacterized protein n=1 Tax=Vespula squamosa TaxID=30214 RepID=A0ABD1ZYR9_VESSQ
MLEAAAPTSFAVATAPTATATGATVNGKNVFRALHGSNLCVTFLRKLKQGNKREKEREKGTKNKEENAPLSELVVPVDRNEKGVVVAVVVVEENTKIKQKKKKNRREKMEREREV